MPGFRRKPPYLLELQRRNRRHQTQSEGVLWQVLRNGQLEGTRFLRQKAFGRYVVDFYCASARLVIELDGEIHDTPDAIEYDAIRTQWLEAQGLRVLRFCNDDITNRLPAVLEAIRQAVSPSNLS